CRRNDRADRTVAAPRAPAERGNRERGRGAFVECSGIAEWSSCFILRWSEERTHLGALADLLVVAELAALVGYRAAVHSYPQPVRPACRFGCAVVQLPDGDATRSST